MKKQKSLAHNSFGSRKEQIDIKALRAALPLARRTDTQKPNVTQENTF
jgi:hypothetical protein